jgi:hypothetical protein
MTLSEDKALLIRLSLTGFPFVGVIGKPGSRRIACEANDLETARRLCAAPTLTVYSLTRRASHSWICVYDRRTEAMGAEMRADQARSA